MEPGSANTVLSDREMTAIKALIRDELSSKARANSNDRHDSGCIPETNVEDASSRRGAAICSKADNIAGKATAESNARNHNRSTICTRNEGALFDLAASREPYGDTLR
eukprot:1198307-Rhodomonas_salina.4